MKGLAAVIIGTIILANVLADDDGQDDQFKKKLDDLLSKEKISKLVKKVQEISHFVTEAVLLSVKVISEGLHPPENVDLIELGHNIVNGLKKLIEGKVQLYSYLLGRILQDILPDWIVHKNTTAVA